MSDARAPLLGSLRDDILAAADEQRSSSPRRPGSVGSAERTRELLARVRWCDAPASPPTRALLARLGR